MFPLLISCFWGLLQFPAKILAPKKASARKPIFPEICFFLRLEKILLIISFDDGSSRRRQFATTPTLPTLPTLPTSDAADAWSPTMIGTDKALKINKAKAKKAVCGCKQNCSMMISQNLCDVELVIDLKQIHKKDLIIGLSWCILGGSNSYVFIKALAYYYDA